MRNGLQIVRKGDLAALHENPGERIGHDHAGGQWRNAAGGGREISQRRRPGFDCRAFGRRRRDQAEGGHLLRRRLLWEKRGCLGAGRRTGHGRGGRLRRRLGRGTRSGKFRNAGHRLGDRRGPGRRDAGHGRGLQLTRRINGKRAGARDIRTGGRRNLGRRWSQRPRRKTDAKSFALGGIRIRALGSSGVSHISPFYSYFGKCSMAKFVMVTYLSS